MIGLGKRSKRPCLILMVEFEKTYNLVSWNFIDYMLIRFWSSEKWMA